MTPTLPENWQQLLAGYVLDDLDEAETTLVEQWLTDYPEVAAELESLQTTWDTLPMVLPEVQPPPGLRDRILATVTASAAAPAAAQALTPHPLPPTPFPWAKLLLGLGWLATAIALAFSWQENQRLRLALRQQEAVVASFSQPANPLYTLAGTPAAPQATARLVVNPADQTALIVTTDLPPLPADQVYRLWALADSDPVFCGQFNPAAPQDTNQWNLPSAACIEAPVQMLITADRLADPPVPAGDLVLQSQS
jgi:hypothetical protein